jgi:hypothetical protein
MSRLGNIPLNELKELLSSTVSRRIGGHFGGLGFCWLFCVIRRELRCEIYRESRRFRCWWEGVCFDRPNMGVLGLHDMQFSSGRGTVNCIFGRLTRGAGLYPLNSLMYRSWTRSNNSVLLLNIDSGKGGGPWLNVVTHPSGTQQWRRSSWKHCKPKAHTLSHRVYCKAGNPLTSEAVRLSSVDIGLWLSVTV